MAEYLRAEGHDVAFAGTPDGLEATLVPAASVPFNSIPSRGFDRAHPLSLVTGALIAVASVLKARRLLRALRPDVVLGMGGYVSLPVGLAAVTRRIPLVIHEQNSVPGLANRVLSRWACAAGTTYEGSIRHLKHPDRAVVTGNPVREAVIVADRSRGREALDLPEDAVVLLVFGGSRGARHLNDALIELAPALMAIPGLHVLHVAGKADGPDVTARVAAVLGGESDRYRVVEYIDTMGDALAAADAIVARAGATSIAEITAVGRPAVLVPYPYATDDHQTLNARAVAQAGGAEVVPDAELDTDIFTDAVLRLVTDPERRERMAAAARTLARRDAAERVAALVHAAASGKETR